MRRAIGFTVAAVTLGGCFPGPLDISEDVADAATATTTTAADSMTDSGGTAVDTADSEVPIDTGTPPSDTVADSATEVDTVTDLCPASDPCPPPAACHDPGVCNPETGECSYRESIGGTSCDDEVRCTAGEVCRTGVCEGTRPPDDRVNDFEKTFTGSQDVFVAGLAVSSEEIAVVIVVAQPEGVGPHYVDLGPGVSRSQVTVGFEADRHSVILARLQTDGRVIGGEVVATSAEPITVHGIAPSLAGGYRIHGLFHGSLEVANPSDLLETERPVAAFSFVTELGPENYVLDGTSADELVAGSRIIASGPHCVFITPVQGSATAEIRSGEGAVLATFDTPETRLGSNHIGWAPGCDVSITARRQLTGGDSSSAAVVGVAQGAQGHVAVGGFYMGVVDVLGADGTEIQSFGADDDRAGFVVAFDSAFAVTARAQFSPPAGSDLIPAISGLAIDETGFGVGIGLYEDTTIVTSVGSYAAAGNPGAGNAGPRSLLVRFSGDGTPSWMAPEVTDPKEDKPFQDIHLAGKRIVATGLISESSFGNSPAITVTAQGGMYAGGYEDGQRLWGLSLFASDTIASHAELVSLVSRPFPGSKGLVVAGTSRAAGRVGSSRTAVISGPLATGFVVRINSEDGIGCDAE